MSKVNLVMEMPESCSKCPMINGNDECVVQDEDANFYADTWDKLKAGCPLRELPEKKQNACTHGYAAGWNACIDAIGGRDCE